MINVSGYTGVYDGNPHGATGTAKGVESTPADLTSLLSFGATFTNVPGGTAHWTFAGNTNYKSTGSDVSITISKADAVISVSGFAGKYDGNTHGASGTATGVKGEDLSSLFNLGSTFTSVPGGTAHWTFNATYANGNYNSASGDAAITINKADATIVVNGFSGKYDGNAHGATGSATGVKGEDLSSLLNLGASFTDVPGGTAHWTFAGNTNYKSTSSDVSITISQADQTITWSDPAGIIYGTLLSGAQLNATVAGVSGGSPAGALTYMPGAGSLLNAGANALTVNAASTQNYKAASATVHINVAKADQTITWASPAGIVYGTPLSGVQLNATVVGATGGSAPGALGYTPSAGTILDAGLGQTLGVTAAETDNYKPASKSVSIDVAKGNQTINWNNPAGITYGTLLGPAQLNAVVIGSGPSAIGAVSYSPANGIMLNAGNGQPLTVNVAGTSNYNPSTKTVSIDVAKAAQIINWSNPAPIVLGTPLGSAQLNATVTGVSGGSPTGALTYAPGAGTLLAVNTQTLSVTAAATANYNLASKTVQINVQYATGGMCGGDAGHQILQPINAGNPGNSVFKQGSTVPAKFRVCDVNGNSIGTTGLITGFVLYQINSGTIAPIDETIDNSTNDLGWRFDPMGQQWIFNMSTKTAPANKMNQTYYFRIDLNDGTSVYFNFGLK